MDGFWPRVDALLLSKHMTQKELAERGGISYDVMRQQRYREQEPKADVIIKIATVLDTTTDYLLIGGDVQHSLSPEARYVEEHPEARALVRAVMRDPALLSALSAVIVSSEKIMDDRKGS